MAEGEHLSEQTRHLWLADKSTPLEGTEKHPQGRLFNPGGSYTGDPMRLHPENWLGHSDTPAHSDPVSWHGSEESSLPRSDEYEHRQYDPYDDPYSEVYTSEDDPFFGADEDSEPPEREDYSTDTKDRPMGEYGSVVGMHFGSIEAATKRAPRPFIHPARIPESTMAAPPNRNFSTPKPGGAIVSGSLKSERDIVNSQTGERTPDERWSDVGANYSEKATDLVEKGKTLAYRNDVEAAGSTSYRTLPETARTWSEDVMSAVSPRTGHVASKYGYKEDTSLRNEPHPALVHLAEKGYDPVVLGKGAYGVSAQDPVQMPLWYDPEHHLAEETKKVRTRSDEFNAGKTWQLRQPNSIG